MESQAHIAGVLCYETEFTKKEKADDIHSGATTIDRHARRK